MESNIIKLDVTATRIGNDSTQDSLSVSISTPIKDNDKLVGDIPCNMELVTYAIGALYHLAAYIRPEWMDNKEANLTIDVFIDGTKCQSRNGVVVMKPESYTFDICIPSPFVRNSKVEAMKDENLAYRFCAIDSAEPMLVAFANEHFEPMNNGKMQLKCWVDKNVVGAYTFEEFKKNGGHIRQLKQSSRGKYVTDESDFVDTDKSFANVFPNMEKGKLYYVDGEAYSIEEMANVS